MAEVEQGENLKNLNKNGLNDVHDMIDVLVGKLSADGHAQAEPQ